MKSVDTVEHADCMPRLTVCLWWWTTTA